MIVLLHIIFLLYTVYKVSFFCRKGKRYRPFMSAVAYAWGAGAAFVAIAMAANYPEYLTKTNALTLFITGASAGLAWWSGGNVSELFRKLARFKSA